MHGADEGALSAAHHAEPDAAALAESLRCSMAILSLLYFSPSARSIRFLSIAAHIVTTPMDEDRTTEAIARFNQLRRAARPPSPQRASRWP